MSIVDMPVTVPLNVTDSTLRRCRKRGPYMRVQVSSLNIDMGNKNNCYSCPIALALKPLFPTFAEVGTTVAWFIEQNEYRKVALPEEVRSFISDFDAGKPVKPFSFELEV